MTNKNSKIFIVALAIPFFALLSQTIRYTFRLSIGNDVEFAIEGFDPRDLLAGHYLQFRVLYGAEPTCAPPASGSWTTESNPLYVCLKPVVAFQATLPDPNFCKLYISGSCRPGGRFEAGIERYYIPAEKARALESALREKRGTIIVSVGADGKAQIRSLRIDGKDW